MYQAQEISSFIDKAVAAAEHGRSALAIAYIAIANAMIEYNNMLNMSSK